MKRLLLTAAIAISILIATFTSCVDTNTIGSSLVPSTSEVIVEDGFQLAGQSVESHKVQSRTIIQLLGSIDAQEYGKLSSDFVTQFFPVATLDTVIRSISDIDSCKLLMMFKPGMFIGDSVVPMGLEVYKLNKQLPAPIFSDFDPEGYYDTSALAKKVYGASSLSAPSDSVAKLGYREIYVDLPYSVAEELYNIYTTDPASHLSPKEFAKHFPGLYVRNSYGSGRITKIGNTSIVFYYHQNAINDKGNDTIYRYMGSFYQATPEIVTNCNINFDISEAITNRIDAGEQLIVSPAGYDVEVEFPVKDIINFYNENRGDQSVINTLTMSIPVEAVSNTYGIDPPKSLLFILKNKREEFFEKSKVTDNKTSFYANLIDNKYTFTGLREYLIDALERQEELTPEDYTFTLTPIYVDLETTGNSYYGTSQSLVRTITPYIEEPALARLRTDLATITLTFANRNNN
ncbi:MAG: DUF4270 family protein [Muribaculaceae bacterium]|nr:DUF4270 family protein [Muribaculaceae bacterium]